MLSFHEAFLRGITINGKEHSDIKVQCSFFFFLASHLLRGQPVARLADPDRSGDVSAYMIGFARFHRLVTPDLRITDVLPLHRRNSVSVRRHRTRSRVAARRLALRFLFFGSDALLRRSCISLRGRKISWRKQKTAGKRHILRCNQVYS